MRFTFRTKLLASHVGLVAAVVLILLFELDRSLGADLVRQLDQRMEAQALGASQWVGGGRHPERLAPRLAGVVGGRVMIFEPDGTVVGDAEPSEAGRVADLPEIAAARQGRVGTDTRIAPSIGERMRYVAVPGGEGVILRLGVPLSDVSATLGAMRARLLLSAAVAVTAALLLGLFASRVASRPLRAMTASASRIARGDYDIALSATSSPDEFGVLARALTSLAVQLKRLETVRRDFIANVSHELRTPVTAIQGYAETLLTGTADEPTRRRFLEIIHRHAHRLGRLVEDLLRLSALEAMREGETPRERIEVGIIAERVASTLQRRADAEGVTVEIDVAGDAVGLGDPSALEQVVENLVDNALKYGRPRGVIRVTARRDGDRVRLAVADDGPGIDASHLPRLFERFYRVDAGRSRERGGTGLGLAIVKHLIESMDGVVVVESEVGKGSTFVVMLPATRSDGSSVGKSSRPPSPAAASR